MPVKAASSRNTLQFK